MNLLPLLSTYPYGGWDRLIPRFPVANVPLPFMEDIAPRMMQDPSPRLAAAGLRHQGMARHVEAALG